MKPNNFFGKLHKLQHSHADDPALLLAPRLAQMPLPIQRYDDPFLPFGKAIIQATRNLVSAYVFDFAAYLALGAAGAVALERTVAYVGGETLTVLHGPFVGNGYVEAAAAFAVDAVTLADDRSADAYRAAGLGVFVVEGDLIGEGLRLPLLGEDVLYTGRGEDFAEQVRAALQHSRRSS